VLPGLLIILGFFFYSNLAFSQCTPNSGLTDPEGNGQMSPDTLYGQEGVNMNTTLSIIAPDTASVPGYSGYVTIHHVTITGIQGKPAWLSYACNPANCEYTGSAVNCALVTGTPPVGSAGTILVYPILDVYISVMGAPVQALTGYVDNSKPLVLIVAPAAGVEELGNTGFGVIANKPNPFINTTEVGCYTVNAETVTLNVFTMTGNSVYTETINTRPGENKFMFNGQDLSSGMYFYTLTDSRNNTISRKMVKSN